MPEKTRGMKVMSQRLLEERSATFYIPRVGWEPVSSDAGGGAG